MYAQIDERRSVRKLYTENLLNRGELTVEEAEQLLRRLPRRMQEAFEETKEADDADGRPGAGAPRADRGASARRHRRRAGATRADPRGRHVVPAGLRAASKAQEDDREAPGHAGPGRHRLGRGEALAFGSLLLEGFTVRLAGQDSRRGTFSQRHSVLVDYRDRRRVHSRSANLGDDQGPFRVFDSLLSEFAALGFEYGYSVANGDALVCWEAQFGDFVNGAQVIIDQFIVAGEDKWDQESGLVLLLPHGYEGQGPEHSSARLERFLTLAAEDTIQVVQPTTAAQYFHVLRRQLHRTIRKPLIVMTPKWLLRLPDARSRPRSSCRVTSKRPSTIQVEDPATVKRILLCTGKIAYLLAGRETNERPRRDRARRAALPVPAQQLAEIFERYPNATEVVGFRTSRRTWGPGPSSTTVGDSLDKRLT